MAKARGDTPLVPENPPMFKEEPDRPDVPPDGLAVPRDPQPREPLARKKPEYTKLSGDLQAAAKIDRVLGKMSAKAALATLEYLLEIYDAKAGPLEAK